MNGNITCDHYAVSLNINTHKPDHIRKVTTFREFRDINVPDFIEDIKHCETLMNVNQPVEELVATYINYLSKLVDRHAPECTKTITLRPNTPWYTDTLRHAKHERIRAERNWRKTCLTVHWQIFKNQCKVVNKLLVQEKRNYYCNKIAECGSNQRRLFSLTKDLMGVPNDATLPLNTCVESLANQFGDFFINKVAAIREEYDTVLVMPRPVWT